MDKTEKCVIPWPGGANYTTARKYCNSRAVTRDGHRRRYAMSGVSVSGLSSVDMKTAFGTNAGATSNSRARIVVKTDTGIDASMKPACRAAPDRPSNYESQSTTIGSTKSDKPTANGTTV